MSRLIDQSYLLLLRLFGVFDCVGGKYGHLVGFEFGLIRSTFNLFLVRLVIVEGLPILYVLLLHPIAMVFDAVYFKQNLTEYVPIGDIYDERFVTFGVIVLLKLDCDDSSRQIFYQHALPLHICTRLFQVILVEL